jgi:CheY-like chemotaxis protein
MTPTAAELLVVEDDQPSRDLLRRRLQREGYGVVTAADGREALRELEQQTFAVVLLDIDMPGMTGLDVLTEIRRHHSLFDVPVIMVTASQDGDDVREALTRGANDYITKPVNFPVALTRIHTQLALKNAAVWDWNLATDEMHFSPRWSDLLGLNDDRWCWTARDWLARVHPDDVGRLTAAIAAHVQGDTPFFEIEHRVQRGHGGWCSMVTRGLGVREDGQPLTRIVGWVAPVADALCRDVTGVAPSQTALMDRWRGLIARSKPGFL